MIGLAIRKKLLKEKIMKKVIAISTDQNYLMPVETLIKSIAYPPRNPKIYVINEDISQEWFINLNRRLAPLNITVQDAKLDPAIIQDEKISVDYLSKMTYGRILIPKLIPEDRALYLDADTIVDRNLDDLFNIDMQGYPAGAIPDYFGDFFNSGVMLFDNQQLRETNFVQDLLERGKTATIDNDQTLLNEEFKGNYLVLPGTYNVQVGGDLVTFFDPSDVDRYENELKKSEPYSIIHYTTNDKPWKTTTSLRLRDKWWQYRELDYSEIVNHQPLPNNDIPNKQGVLFTFTNDENIKYLYELAEALPNYEFNIAAYTLMGFKLIRALRYPNVHLYPSITSYNRKRLLAKADGYLDINYGGKNEEVIQKYVDKGIPVLSFDEVATERFKNADNYQTFANDDLSGMVEAIRKLK